MSGATHHDPRSIITPDAFDVSGELLGMPLAAPGKRFAALMIDLVVIGVITVTTKSFALVLGVVAAIFFMRAGFKRTPVKGSVFNRAMRLSVGCLGLFIAFWTAALWWLFGPSFGGDDSPDSDSVPALVSGLTDSPFMAAVGAIAVNAFEERMAEADDLEEAEEAFLEFVEAAEELGVSRGDMLDMVGALVPDDASWADEAESRFRALLGDESAEADNDGAAARERVEAEVAAMDALSALNAFAAVLAVDDDEDEAVTLRREVLRTRLTTEIAADSLAELEDRITTLERQRSATRARLEATEAQLEEETSGGLFNTLREFVDELGFGFGWASLYLTVVLSWWNGQTVGKKMLGLRVVRLDGEPITWWIAFERAGGYAAGFATGLLGFAQVYWDANRQAIHDRIVGTVVVVDGAEKVVDWESAL